MYSRDNKTRDIGLQQCMWEIIITSKTQAGKQNACYMWRHRCVSICDSMCDYMWLHVWLYVTPCVTICDSMCDCMWLLVWLYVTPCVTIYKFKDYRDSSFGKFSQYWNGWHKQCWILNEITILWYKLPKLANYSVRVLLTAGLDSIPLLQLAASSLQHHYNV